MFLLITDCAEVVYQPAEIPQAYLAVAVQVGDDVILRLARN